jgi:hypothetical protein
MSSTTGLIDASVVTTFASQSNRNFDCSRKASLLYEESLEYHINCTFAEVSIKIGSFPNHENPRTLKIDEKHWYYIKTGFSFGSKLRHIHILESLNSLLLKSRKILIFWGDVLVINLQSWHL